MLLSVSKVVVGILLIVTVTAKQKRRQYWPRPTSDCEVRRGFLQTKRDGCKFTISTSGCGGSCLSSAKPFSHRIGFASSCSCCAPIEATIKEKSVSCHGVTKVIRYPEAKKCACRPCLNGWHVSSYEVLKLWSKDFSSCKENGVDVATCMNLKTSNEH